MKGNSKVYKVKSIGAEIDDVDAGSRMVSGYLSAFNKMDSDRDVIKPGAFAQSIAMRGPDSPGNRKIAFLRMHNWEKQIGRFTELVEDDYGLKFSAYLSRSREGEDALRDYQDEVIREHSIGFQYVGDGMDYNEDDDIFTINEIKLFEGSAVTFGANEFTYVIDVAKGLSFDQKHEEAKRIADQIDAIANALKNGKGTDERLYNLEMQLRVLNAKHISLFESLRPGSVKTPIATEGEKNSKPNGLDFLRSIANI